MSSKQASVGGFPKSLDRAVMTSCSCSLSNSLILFSCSRRQLSGLVWPFNTGARRSFKAKFSNSKGMTISEYLSSSGLGIKQI